MLANTIKTRGLHASLRFAPAVSLDRERKRQFQHKLSSGFDWARHDYSDKVWRLASPQAEGDPRSQIKMTVEPDQLHYEDLFPINPFDVFADNLQLAFEQATELFSSKIMMASRMVVRMTAQADGNDARLFLGKRCLGLEERLGPLGRPVHAIGLKMLLPAIPLKEQPPWQCELKVESLVEDVRQLFIEVDAHWAVPAPMAMHEVIRRARVAHAFANSEVIQFLQGFESDTP